MIILSLQKKKELAVKNMTIICQPKRNTEWAQSNIYDR